MSLKSNFFSLLTLVIAVVAFSTIGLAQESTTKTTTPDKAEKRQKAEDREIGGGGFGQRGMGGRHFGQGMRHRGAMRMMHGLNLTDEQKTQLRAIKDANKPSQETMQELRTLLIAKRDGTITAEQQTRLATLKTQAREKAAAIHEQIKGILTAEQKQQIEQRKLETKQRMQERKQMRQPKTPPTGTTTEKKPN